MRLTVCLFCLMILAGCATMDLNTMDTAIPIFPDRASISTYIGLGVDYSSPFFKGEDYMEQENPVSDRDGLTNDFCTAAKLGIPISPNLDLQAKIYQSGFSWGAKLGFKNMFHHEGKHYLAMMPMLTHISGKVEKNDDEGNEYNDSYLANGIEVTGLYSYEANKHLTGTMALRYNVSFYKEESDQVKYDDLVISHGGLSANLRLKLSVFMLTAESGVEVLPNKDSKVLLSPVSAIGIGFQF